MKTINEINEKLISTLEEKVKILEEQLIIQQNLSILKDYKLKDLHNWVKSDIAQETNPKIGKTATPYRTEKLKFLYKIKEMLRLE